MVDGKLFYDKPASDHARTRVVEAGTEDGRPWVRLEETIFHPEGGGQPADRGTVGGADVLDVVERDGRILHFLDRPVATGEVETELDLRYRVDLSQQHSAQHLLTAILWNRHDRPTTAFHLGESYSAIEVVGPVPSEADLAVFEQEANEEIRRGRRVRTRRARPDELAGLGVRSRGLPSGHEGEVRLVEIEGVDLNTCGGTHVENLSELQALHILGAEPARGGTRIRFIAGRRLLTAMRERGRTEAELRNRLGAGPECFGEVLDGWIRERKRHERRVRTLEESLAGAVAATLTAQPGPRLETQVVPGGSGVLKAVAKLVLEARPEATVVLTGRDPESGEACFLVQAGPDGEEDVSEVGEEICRRLGARGGGRGKLYQGGGGRFP